MGSPCLDGSISRGRTRGLYTAVGQNSTFPVYWVTVSQTKVASLDLVLFRADVLLLLASQPTPGLGRGRSDDLQQHFTAGRPDRWVT